MTQYLYTAESVAEGHPDKLCDIISDSILDAVLEEDRNVRAIVQTVITRGLVLVTGDLTTRTYLDIDGVVRRVLLEAGYDDPDAGFDHRSGAVLSLLKDESEQIATIVDKRRAGDQGMMVGYATDEALALDTDTRLMPMPTATAHALMRRLREVRRDRELAWLRPDGKCQVTFVYENRVPVALASLVLSCQHAPGTELDRVRAGVREAVVEPVLAEFGLEAGQASIEINPAGPFVQGGPAVDAGLTGRKTVSDTYGPMVHHGGSALSGKDPTKLDRSATYAARWVARTLVGAGMAQRCSVDLAYTVGRGEPASIRVETYGTGARPDPDLAAAVQGAFDLTLPGILNALELRRVRYAPLAAFGHFGRPDLDLPWERDTEIETLLDALGD